MIMPRVVRTSALTVTLVALGILLFQYGPRVAQAYPVDSAPTVPAFTHHADKDWINSKPLTWQALRGKVVLLDFWTFMCWNCYRSFPWLTSMEADFGGQDFIVIGVHTPEFDSEKDRKRIADRAHHFGLHHPIMVDNDHSYWNAIGNRYWPAYFLVDKQGKVRYFFAGETHVGDRQAKKIEARIKQLLAEPANG